MSSSHHKLLGKHFYGRSPYISHLRAIIARLGFFFINIFPFVSRKNTSHLNQKGAKGGPSSWDIFGIWYNCATWFSILEPITFFRSSLRFHPMKRRRNFLFVKIKLGQHFGVNRLSAIPLVLLRHEFYHEALLGVYWTPHTIQSRDGCKKVVMFPGSNWKEKRWMQNVSRNLFFCEIEAENSFCSFRNGNFVYWIYK